MKTVINLFLIFTMIFISISCNEITEPDQQAIQMSRTELGQTIGYTWFNVYINDYTPNDSLTHIIDSLFNRDKHSLIFFLEPECTCKELVKDPAYLVKILDYSNVFEDNYQFWGLGSADAEHPYKDIIHIKELPHIAFMRDSNYVYSVLDSFYKYKAYKKWVLENALIDALEKYQ